MKIAKFKLRESIDRQALKFNSITMRESSITGKYIELNFQAVGRGKLGKMAIVTTRHQITNPKGELCAASISDLSTLIWKINKVPLSTDQSNINHSIINDYSCIHIMDDMFFAKVNYNKSSRSFFKVCTLCNVSEIRDPITLQNIARVAEENKREQKPFSLNQLNHIWLTPRVTG